MVESQSGCKIKVLRSNNGKKYTSKEFNMFCENMSIIHELTMTYTLEQNGIFLGKKQNNDGNGKMFDCKKKKKKATKELLGRNYLYNNVSLEQATNKSCSVENTN